MFGIVIFLMGCIPALNHLALVSGGGSGVPERIVINSIARQLEMSGYRVLGRHQKLQSKNPTHVLAEFDLILRDSEGRLCVAEIKQKVGTNKKKVKRQFSRYVEFLKTHSPFEEPIERVIIISPSLTAEEMAPWKAEGLEFFKLIKGQYVSAQAL